MSLFGRWLHGILLATAFVVAAWQITGAMGLTAGAIGAIVGTLLAERVLKLRLRIGVALVGIGALGLLFRLLLGLVETSEIIAGLLGPVEAIFAAEVVRWLGSALVAALALRTLAIHYRAALALEGSAVVAAVVSTVAAHRDGMIARPLEVSDWFWRQGIDPVMAFLGIGLFGALLLAGILAYGRSGWRTIVQLVLVFLLGLFLASRIHGTNPETKLKNAVGQSLEQQQDDGRGGQGGGQSKEGQQQEKDGLPPPGSSGGQNRPAAIVVFHKDVMPMGGVFYFRHAAFSQFNGARLVEATMPGLDPDARYEFPTEPRNLAGPHIDAPGRSQVATDVALLTEHPRLFALMDAEALEPMANPDPARFKRAYRVVSAVPVASFDELLGHQAGAEDWPDATWSHYTELPKDPRYRGLARTIEAGLKGDYREDPLALAFSVKRYLETTAIYSFARKYEGDDPVGEFLFGDDRRGYCVHTAHAAAYLMRALGLPSRVSAGYAVPAENLAGGSALLIKAGDAHAWAEVYLDGLGWIPIEVTPEKTEVEPPRFEEKDLQQLLGEMARKEGRFERRSQSASEWVALLKKLVAMLPWLLVALVAVAYLVKLWRLWAPQFFPNLHLAHRAAVDRLAAVGWVRRRGESRERFAIRSKAVAPSFEPLTRAQAGSILGSREPLSPLGQQDPRSWARQVGREVRIHVAWWRWALGALNPVSWWWSR